MDREQIVAALTALGARLSDRGIDGEVYVVGGAAIAIAFDARRATRDVDAIFEPKQAVYAAADEVGDALGLPPGWLNDGVKGFVAGPDDDAATVLEAPGLRVLVASPRILLAMKVLAHRIGEDDDDVRLLAAELRLEDADAVLAVAEEVYGERLDAAARFFVEELFAGPS
jgi:hypothetical protein